ncbi:MAG TPA: GxGYxYP domain-containing protein [Candidatus Dormibacteraeota bacterium]|jgi:hypothetical protein|nr:GxGYxYP domain-containing protein [Candidatus Dormibacteraeota bacterium]
MSITRRDLLKIGGVAAGATALGLPAISVSADGGPQGAVWPPGQELPRSAPPKHLDVADIRTSDGDTQTLLTTLQGVVNRTQPRIYTYLQNDGTDVSWLQTSGVPFTVAGDPMSVVAKYARQVRGTVVWDPSVPDTLNVATSLAGLENGVVATAALAKTLAGAPYHLPVIKDLTGQFADKFAAYDWALSNLWPRLTHRMLTAISPTQVITAPGVTWTTIFDQTTQNHDASNEGTFTSDLSSYLTGGDGSVYVKFTDSFSNDGWGASVGNITVTANGQTIANFNPGTSGETPYVYDLDSSQVGTGSQFGFTTWRFGDGTNYFIYKFTPPSGTTTLSLSVTMWNQFLVTVTDTAPDLTVGFPDLRDYIVANQALCFWLDPTVTAEATLFASILTKVAPDTPYLGWFPDGNEDQGVTLCSDHGIPVLAADFFTNGTVWAGIPGPIRGSQPRVKAPALANKVYVTITMSDGDNIQFDEHQLRIIWDDPNRGKVPINWSIDPALIEAAPAMYSYYQRTQTANDLLVAAPSGAGYTYPGDWPSSMLDSYTKRTGQLMAQGGLDIIYILNRNQGNDIALTDAVAASYERNVHPLPGILYNGDSPSTVTVNNGNLPVITEPNITDAAGGTSIVSSAISGWDGQSPLFVAIMPIAWNMAPTDVVNLVTAIDALNADCEVVRADVFFTLLRQHLNLPPG